MPLPNNIIYKDIDLDFRIHPKTADVTTVTNENAIKRSILNLILTNKYEKRFQPNVYCGIKSYLFQPIDSITSSAIAESIQNVINNYEPRVNIKQIDVVPDIEQDGYYIAIQFYMLNNVPITLTTFLERIR